VDVQSGDVVNAGQQAFTLANRNQLHVDTLIDETEISGVNIGDSATITLDSLPGQVLTGKVSFINPVGQQVSGNIKYPVKIDLDPVEMLVLLKATADVTIQVGEPLLSLLVPVRSIQLDDTGEFVNRLNEDGSIERIDVITGDLSGDQVVIYSSDLAEGERVQLVSSNDLADQMSQMPGFGGR
jgi:HlyD family secretion protein